MSDIKGDQCNMGPNGDLVQVSPRTEGQGQRGERKGEGGEEGGGEKHVAHAEHRATAAEAMRIRQARHK